VLSNDQEMRAQSIIMAAFMWIVTSLGVVVNRSGEGAKMAGLLLIRVWQAVGNHDTDTLFLSRVDRQVLHVLHRSTDPTKVTGPAKDSPI
jgi:hypothetical protein